MKAASGLITILLILIISVGSYTWYTALAVCPVPIGYRLGTLDSSFNLSEAAALSAIAEAEALWEDETGRNLFSYDDEADFTINFVFDERQELTEVEGELSDALNALRKESEDLKANYESLGASYKEANEAYQKSVASYERDLDAHNAEVARWNDEGGAPPEEFEKLNQEQARLAAVAERIDAERKALNDRISEVNDAAEKATAAVDAYNAEVGKYNDTFKEATEFTQGDYQGDSINIYQFTSREELILVLAHELGHALGIEHVEGEDSIMYQLMAKQRLENGPTEFDLAAFTASCGEGSTISKLRFW